jgi:hypothetical protein
VPEKPHTSRDLLVLVEQPTEPVVPSNGQRSRGRALRHFLVDNASANHHGGVEYLASAPVKSAVAALLQ